MSLSIVYSRAQSGVQAPPVTVEVHLSGGLPSLSIVGLPETAVRESKERVRSALLHSGFQFPSRRITINLAPADLPKQGGRYDLAIALGILAASGQINDKPLLKNEFLAELALGGALRPVQGTLPSALAVAKQQRLLVCARDNGPEAALADCSRVRTATHLLDVCAWLNGAGTLHTPRPPVIATTAALPDLEDVRGQAHARRALEVAAAGNHSLLFVGPPGTGKTLLASRLPGILPPLTDQEALESAAVASVSTGRIDTGRWRQRPFRAPHHTASAAALVGGGSDPRPGEISLAHQGVLFLDELPEFRRSVLEVLREPLESGTITISRAARQTEFPARFQLVAAMNPCPCGYQGDPDGECRCSREQVRRYRARISGPLLDRMDLQVAVPRLQWDELDGQPGESSQQVLERVQSARIRQQQRGCLNAELTLQHMQRACALDTPGKAILQQAANHFRLSPRAVHRILKVARSIADLARSESIRTPHLQEAIGYRCQEKQ